MENPTYLGDAVYAFHDGFGIELRVNDHRNECVVYLEPSVLSTLVRWDQLIREKPTEPTDPAKPPELDPVSTRQIVVETLAAKKAQIESEIGVLSKCASIMERLPEDVVPGCCINGEELVIYHCTRERVLAIMSALGAGKWEKKINLAYSDKIDYDAVVDGVNVQLWGAAPPASCKIVEEEVEVPAHKTIKRTLVCK